MWASIQAIESNSISEIRKLITYWVSLSSILIFEELLKLSEWTFWHFLKLILVGCLVSPDFDGSLYVYKHIIRPCLSVDPQVVVKKFIKLMELFLEKYNLRVVIERDVIKDHEPEAPKNLIAFKSSPFKLHLQTGKFQPDIAPAEDIIRGALEIKDLTASMASCKDLPDRPSKEWSCPICQVTTINEEVFVSHLQGQRHKAAFKKLKTKNRMVQSENSFASAAIVAPEEMATAVEVGSDDPDKQPKSIKEWNCPTCQVTTTDETAFIYHLHGRRHDAASWKLKANNQLLKNENSCAALEMGTPKDEADIPEQLPCKNPHKEWICPMCQVTSTSELVFISHLQGRRHEVACEKLKYQMLQNENSDGLVKMDAAQEMATTVGAGGEWTCPICQVTITTETNFILHLQGKLHEAASKMLKAKNQILRGENSPDSVKTSEPKESKKNIQEWTCPICQVTATSETIFISHLQGSQHEVASDKLKAENLMLQSKNPLELVKTGPSNEVATMSEAGSSSTVCQVVSTNETDPIIHLQGKQNEDMREWPKAKNQTSRSKVFAPPMETYIPSENIDITTASTVVNEDIPDKPHSRSELQEYTSGEVFLPKDTKDEAMRQRRHENLRNEFIEARDSEWWCTICNVRFNSDRQIDSHLNGRKHLDREQNGVRGSGLI